MGTREKKRSVLLFAYRASRDGHVFFGEVKKIYYTLNMDDEKLIECVRKYPVLYDMTHVKYLDSKYKYSVWKLISTEMNEDEDNCKKRWTNIRDQFKKQRNKRKGKSGQGATNIKKYKYEDTLQFLLPYEEERNTLSNLQSNQMNSEQIQDQTQIHVDPLPVNEQTNQHETLPDTLQDTLQNTHHDTHSTLSPQNQSSTKNRYRRTKPTQPNESASNTLMKYIVENNAKKQTDIHPIDAFLNGLAPTIKKLSPYRQHVAKGKIFAIVQELELEQILSTESSSFVNNDNVM